MEDNFNLSIINKTKGKIPNLPFVFIKNKILGEKYSLSIVFIGENMSQKLNNKYRNKNKSTNILSFPLSKKEGEILICIKKMERELKLFNKKKSEMILFLVIHGMLHLKGMEHSSTMEREENKYLLITKKFLKNK